MGIFGGERNQNQQPPRKRQSRSKDEMSNCVACANMGSDNPTG